VPRHIYNTGYTNEAMCSRGCRGEDDEGGGTVDGPGEEMGDMGWWGRVLLRRPGEEAESGSSECAGRETERGRAREEAERRAMEREAAPRRCGWWAKGGSPGRRGGGRRGLWMSGRQCRDAKGGIEVSLAPRGGGGSERARGCGGGGD